MRKKKPTSFAPTGVIASAIIRVVVSGCCFCCANATMKLRPGVINLTLVIPRRGCAAVATNANSAIICNTSKDKMALTPINAKCAQRFDKVIGNPR